MNPLREKSKSQNVALKLNLSLNAFHGTTPLGINQILSWNKIRVGKNPFFLRLFDSVKKRVFIGFFKKKT